MELERADEFVLKIGDKRYRAIFKSKTPGREFVFQLLVKTKITEKVVGDLLFKDYDNVRYFSKGCFYFPVPDLAIFCPDSGFEIDRRGFERLKTEEITGFLIDVRNIEKKMAISAFDLSEKGTKIATYYSLPVKKHKYIIELQLDPNVFPFFNLSLGNAIFSAYCEVSNIQVGKDNEVFYGLNFTKIPPESEHLLKIFLREYEKIVEDKNFDALKESSAYKDVSTTLSEPIISEIPAQDKEEKKYKGTINTADIKPLQPISTNQVANEELPMPHFSWLVVKSKQVVLVSVLSFLIIYMSLFFYQYLILKGLKKEVAGTPNVVSAVSEKEEVEEKVLEQPEVETPLVATNITNAKNVEVIPFIPSVKPAGLTSENFVEVLKENKLPIYSIDGVEYVSLRSVLKLFMYEGKLEKNSRSVTIPYNDTKIILNFPLSQMVIKNEIINMMYPIKMISDEVFVSVDVMEEALILAQ
ncbi:copper amine oxidase N-terminal domain-containing protein [bacterium]|nr:copper amine oxidase N-terminal domain-containing protein [bacterium]